MYIALSNTGRILEVWYGETWSKSEEYRFYGNPAEEPSGPGYCLASVRFGDSGRSWIISARIRLYRSVIP